MLRFGPLKHPERVETFATIKYSRSVHLDTKGLTTESLAKVLPVLRKRANRWPGSVSYNTFIFLSACQEILARMPEGAIVADIENEAWDLVSNEDWVPSEWREWKRREDLRGRL